ncbi:MAG: ABC transporter ATP-binding protein [Spirochaetota bacterium]
MLTVESLRVSYGRVRAVKGVDFSVQAGEIVSLIGANGAGKSSTLLALAGAIEAEGSVTYRGEDIRRLGSSDRVRRGLVLCPEGRHIFPELDVEENLRMGAFRRGSYREKSEEVFELFPVLAERLSQVAGYLSGGEQQMLSIGRALMADPELLMLDEPSLGLAPILVDQVFAVLGRLREMGYSILLVEQNANRALHLSDRTYILETGRIAAAGASNDLLADDSVRRAYLGI